MIKYISIIKDSDKGLFRYMKKYSNNFSLLSRAITPKPGIKDQFYRSQKDKKKSVSFQWNEKKRERERKSTWQKEFSSWYWNNGEKNGKLIG